MLTNKYYVSCAHEDVQEKTCDILLSVVRCNIKISVGSVCMTPFEM